MDDAPRIRVLIADDHAMVLEGLKVILSLSDEFEIVGTASNGAEAVEACERLTPDVVLMDVKMPVLDGAEATSRIRAARADTQVIALTSFVEEDYVVRTVDAGAIGYLLKDSSPDVLLQAIRDARVGRGTVDSTAMQALRNHQKSTVGDNLTTRELEVLALLASGLSNNEIAQKLTLSAGTVRLHVSNILAKLDAPNRTTAVILAMKHGLV